MNCKNYRWIKTLAFACRQKYNKSYFLRAKKQLPEIYEEFLNEIDIIGIFVRKIICQNIGENMKLREELTEMSKLVKMEYLVL